MEDKKSFIINILYYALIFAAAYVFCNYLFGVFAPFILGFIFAYIAVRLSKRIFKKDNKALRIISLLIFYVIIVTVIVLLTILGINEFIGFIESIPSLYKQFVEPVFQNINQSINEANSNLPMDVKLQLSDILNGILDSIKSLISSISTSIVSSITSLISNTTSVIISVLTTLITSFFVVADYEAILYYIESLLDDSSKEVYKEVKYYLVNTVFLVIKSYGFIMFVTFVELFVGLMIMRISNFGLVAMIIAFLDILPVLGVGTVLLPWALFELITGNIGLCVGLVILYSVISIIRNILEPKIVGGNLGLHPLATLFSMMIGLEFFGVLGMFGLPLLISFLIKRKQAIDVRVK